MKCLCLFSDWSRSMARTCKLSPGILWWTLSRISLEKYSFIFLQIYYSPMFSDDAERPVALRLSQVTQRAVICIGQNSTIGHTQDRSAVCGIRPGCTRTVQFHTVTSRGHLW